MAAAGALSASQRPSASDLFHDALRVQESQGDLPRAIEMYQSIVDRFSADRTVAPKALLEMARCYEILGRIEAGRIYEQIVAQYASSPAATVARAKLSDGQKAPGLIARQVWSDTGDAISADGKLITSTNWETGDLVIYEFSSGKTKAITTHGKWNGSFAYWTRLSPDSRQIAYGWHDDASSEDTLRVVSRSGGTPRILHRAASDESVSVVDWSPDGKTVYVMLDKARAAGQQTPRGTRLIAFPIDGRPLQVLKEFATQDAGRLKPQLSPDGRWFAYSGVSAAGRSDRDIRLLSLSTREETTLNDHPADDVMAGWFPAGDRILFLSDRGGTRGLWSMAVRDGQAFAEPHLVRPDVGSMGPYGFARNGDFYYSVSFSEVEVYVGSLPTIGSGPQRLERVTSRFLGQKRQAEWSPSGGRLAYARPEPDRPTYNRELAIHDVATGVARIFPLTMAQFQNPVWMPDERSVVIQGRNVDGSGGLYVVNTENGQVTPIATRGAVPEDLQRLNPAVSPDGKRLYYTWKTPGQDSGGIASRDMATGQETKITTTRVSEFALSPDGKWFVTADVAAGGGNRPLSITPVSGGPARPIGAGGPAGWIPTFAWMPDSQSVLAIHLTGTAYEFWVLPIDGGAPRNTGLVWKDGINRLSVSRDGRLALSTDRQRSETWVMQNLR